MKRVMRDSSGPSISQITPRNNENKEKKKAELRQKKRKTVKTLLLSDSVVSDRARARIVDHIGCRREIDDMVDDDDYLHSTLAP